MDKLVSAVADMLAAEGVDARRGFPAQWAGLLKSPCCAVYQKSAALSRQGFFDYLGLIMTDDGERELYGRRLEAEIAVDILAPTPPKGALEDCVGLFAEVSAVLGSLSGKSFKTVSLECGEVRQDESICALRLPCSLKVQAYFYALGDEDGEFTDFELKGRLLT